MRTLLVVPLAAMAILCQAPTVRAQAAGYSQITNQTLMPGTASVSGYERSSGRSNPALTYFGGAKHAAYLPQTRPMLPRPLPVQTSRLGKPFSGLSQGPAVSPYLGLEARESESSLPNYYLFVKPQLDQQRLNEVQQAQYRRLQQQVRTTTATGVVPTSAVGGVPTTGHSAQFLNNGGFYPTMTR